MIIKKKIANIVYLIVLLVNSNSFSSTLTNHKVLKYSDFSTQDISNLKNQFNNSSSNYHESNFNLKRNKTILFFGISNTILIIFLLIFIIVLIIIKRRFILGVIRIPNQKVGLVTKIIGKPIPNNHLIARNGEAGPQAFTLSSGWHIGFWPWAYTIQLEDVTNIKIDEIGWIEAKDGEDINRGKLFGIKVECDNYQDGESFLKNGGQKGKQSNILTTGSYRINSFLFKVNIEKIITINSNEIGLVEALDGAPISNGRLFGKAVDCNNFQDEEKFFLNGGERGKQLSILKEGTYQINSALFKVVVSKKISIEPGFIGLLIAKDGLPLIAGQSFGHVVSCDNFQDANAFFINGGQKGKQLSFLRTGNYQINTNLFDIKYVKSIKINSDEIGLVEALSGATLPKGQNFGKSVECDNFQDANKFIENGGQKGKQLSTLGTGTYYINTFLFKVSSVCLTKIESDEIGIITANDGASLETGQTLGKIVECQNFENADDFIKNGGQKGIQIAILQTGNYQLNTYLFNIKKILLIEINSGEVGLIKAKSGLPLQPGQLLGKVIDCNDFQDAQAFINNGGQKGKQLKILTAGKYKINTELFDVDIVNAIKIAPDQVGLVKAEGGSSLKPGQSFGKVVACNDYQDSEAFLVNGGQAGKQLTVLTTGTYYINTYLFTIEIKQAVKINTDQIGIVEANAGEPLKPGQTFGKIVQCNNFQDANEFFINGGQRGKQLDIITAGTYQINTYLFNIKTKPLIVISPEEIGLVEAKDGSPLKQGTIFGKVVDCNSFQDPQQFFLNNGERGRQLSILQEGTYYINTELFDVRKDKVVNIGPDEIGLVIAHDGLPLERGQILAKSVDCENFQNAVLFFQNGGQKGKQLSILTAGKYRINLDLFTVITQLNADKYDMDPEDLKVTVIDDDKIGIVTTYDGLALKTNEIAGPTILGHEKYQNAQKFIDSNGQQGLQEETLPSGRWNLNPWFVKVLPIEITEVPNGYVGVIKSHVGKNSNNHEKIVDEGFKGIWKTVRRPNKYPINISTQDIVMVPTKEMIIRWSSNCVNDKHDDYFQKILPNLSVTDVDAFTYEVEVTQVFRICEEDAPAFLCKVSSREDSIDEYIEEILEPTVVHYFSIAAQQLSAVDFQKNRSEIQEVTKQYIKEALKDYKIQAIDTLIGEIYIPKNLADHLREIKYSEIRKEKQKQIKEEEKAKSDVEIAKEEQQARLTQIKRDERFKDEDQKLVISRNSLKFQEEKRSADLQFKKDIAQCRADSEKLNIKNSLFKEESLKNIDAKYKEILSNINSEKLREIEKLSPEIYKEIQNMKYSQQKELTKAIALMLTFRSSQINDIDKINAFSNIILPDNPNILVDSGSDNQIGGFGNPVGLLLTQILNGQDNKVESLLKQLELSGDDDKVEQISNYSERNNQLPSRNHTSNVFSESSKPNISTFFPMYLILDTSKSMSGICIDKINRALNKFFININSHESSRELLDMTLLTFSDDTRIHHNPWENNSYEQIHLKADGLRNVGNAMNIVYKELVDRCSYFESNNIQFHKPWVCLFLSGLPSDNWQQSAEKYKSAVDNEKFNFFVVGVKNVDLAMLRQLTPPNIPPVMLDNLKFEEFFEWLLTNIHTIVKSEKGSTVNLSPITTWAQIN